MSRSAYPKYKPSGLGWLEDVPSMWSVTRLRFQVKINPVKSEIRGIPEDTSVSFVPMEAVGEYGGLRLEQTQALGDVANGYTYFRDGDVVVAKITPCFENGKGSIADGLENGIGFGTTELHVLRPSSFMGRNYLFYLTISHAFRKIGVSYMYGAGGQKRVPNDFIRDFRHPIPAVDEQHTIAAFLDRETARIDALIEKKRRQIELLQEKRSALISHAVTKGLNPDAPMKDSGIEWLGRIPAHWGTRRLRYLGYCQNGINIGAEKFGTGYPFVSYGEVYNNSALPVAGSGLVESSDADRTRYSVETGDVFFTRTSETIEEIGFSSVCFKTIPNAVFAGFLIRFRPVGETLNIGFSEFYFRSHHLRAFFVKEMNLVTGASLSQDLLKNMPVLLPPIDEQAQIASMLNQKMGQITSLIQKIQNSITKLQEHRTALISAAVTGKIDVRKEVV